MRTPDPLHEPEDAKLAQALVLSAHPPGFEALQA